MPTDLPYRPPRRWAQLGLGLLAMVVISSPQYTWTLFVKPFQDSTGAGLAAVQLTFSLLVLLQTWLAPLHGFLAERFGPRRLVAAGAGLTGAGWVLASGATSLTGLYLSYGLFCGLGTGIVYIGVIGQVAAWFPDRCGLATGVAAAGYGMGAMLTTFPIDAMIHASGHPTTLVVFGVLFAAVGALAAMGLRAPVTLAVSAPQPAAAAGTEVGPARMLRTPLFWLMFLMMAMMSTGGLMVTSNFASFARDFGVAGATVLGMAALPLALTIDRLFNGFTRPFFGWLSDHIGRENTMGAAFLLEAAAIALLVAFRDQPLAFVLLSGLVFFGWGEIFSLFPSTLADTFGARHATTNYGFLYMAQGVGSVLGGPLAAALRVAAGSWLPVFAIVIALDVLTALLALFVLKRARRAYAAGGRRPLADTAALMPGVTVG